MLFLYPPGNKTLNCSILEGVTSIGEFTFKDCPNLQTIFFPESVKEIKMGAFLTYYDLRSINIQSNISLIGPFAFGDTALESIIIPDNIKEIGIGAFRCSKLKTIHIKSKAINDVHIERDIFQDISTECTLYVPKRGFG